MGGRVAEQIIFDTSTSGAANDLQQATRLARQMVLDWGMSDKFKNMALGGEQQNVFLGEELTRGKNYSETTAREIDEEVKAILSDAYERTVETLREHRDEMDRIVDVLIEEEEIEGRRVLEILGIEPEETEAEEPEPEETETKESVRASNEKESNGENGQSTNKETT
jgi:cell division protease FtsH